MSISWKQLERDLFDWVLRVLPDLDQSQVQWENQNLTQPIYPYITLNRGALIGNGAQDETRESCDLDREPGQEVGLETISVREFTLSINAFVDEESGSKDPDCDAFWMMTALQVSLSQLSTEEAFELAGISLIEDLGVIDLSQTQNGRFFSKANMDVRLRVCFSSIERVGYIEHINVTSVPSDPPDPFDVSGVNITT